MVAHAATHSHERPHPLRGVSDASDGARGSLTRFVLRLLGLCTVLFAVWYSAAEPIAASTAWLAARLAESTDAVESVE